MRPIGFWSTRTSRLIALHAADDPAAGRDDGRLRSSSVALLVLGGSSWPSCSATSSTSAWLTRLDLPEPETPVTVVNTPSGKATSSPCRLLRVTPARRSQPCGVRGARGRRARLAEQVARGSATPRPARGPRAGRCRGRGRRARRRPGRRRRSSRRGGSRRGRARRRTANCPDAFSRSSAAAAPRCRPGCRPGRRLVEHVDHAEQVRADLRREPQPLQFARRERRACCARATR